MNSNLPTLSPEMRFLCACSRVNPTQADMDRQAALASVIDMDALVALAIRHRVETLLLHHLRRHENPAFTGHGLDVLESRVRQNAAKSLASVRTNIQLARAAKAQGIAFLPMKGVTLAQRYYGRLDLRQVNDVDFWVPEMRIDQMRKLLVDLGARPDAEGTFQELERGKRHINFLRRQYHEEAWDMSDGAHLELHWRLTSIPRGFQLDPVAILAAGETIQMAGETLTMMAPVPLLLYLCEHGMRHGWFRLKWLFDLPQVLEGNAWNWEEVLAQAMRANCLSSLLLGLKLGDTLFGFKLPPQVSWLLQGRVLMDWQVAQIIERMSAKAQVSSKPTVGQRIKHLIYRITIAGSPRTVCNEAFYYALSHNDLRILRLPDRWFPLYYVLRPILVWGEIIKHRRARSR